MDYSGGKFIPVNCPSDDNWLRGVVIKIYCRALHCNRSEGSYKKKGNWPQICLEVKVLSLPLLIIFPLNWHIPRYCPPWVSKGFPCISTTSWMGTSSPVYSATRRHHCRTRNLKEHAFSEETNATHWEEALCDVAAGPGQMSFQRRHWIWRRHYHRPTKPNVINVT